MAEPPLDPDDRYQTLRDLGVPQAKAAAIANTRPAPSVTDDLSHWSRDELERHAAERGIDEPGRLSREALVRVLRERRADASGTPGDH